MKKEMLFICFFIFIVCFPSTEIKAQDKIWLAVVGPLTGSAAEYGIDQFRGVQLAVSEINKEKGIRKGKLKGTLIDAVSFDDKGDPKEGANNATKIVLDKKFFCEIGPQLSSVSLAMAPIFERANMLLFTPYATTPKLTSQGFKNVFRNLLTGDMEGTDCADKVVKKLGFKKIAVFYENTAYGIGVRDSFVSRAKELGATIVGVETYVQGEDKDFSAPLTKLKALNPDSLFLISVYTEGGLITKQARAMGWNIPIATSTASNSPVFIEIGGKENAEGVHIVAIFHPSAEDPKIQRFVREYEKMFNTPPSESAALAYDAVYIVREAIEMGGTTRGSLAGYLRKIKGYKGLTGDMTFDDKGDVIGKEQLLMVIKGGKFLMVK